VKAYGLIEEKGLKAAPLSRKHWDNADWVTMGHGRRSGRAVRFYMKKAARAAAKRDLLKEIH
jgi:hypothetical protein